MKTILGLLKLSAAILLMASPRANALQARVAVAQAGTNFTYTISNEEGAGSRLFLSNFHLEMNAPFNVASSPAGWSFITDNFSYVDWFCTSEQSPYPNDVAPGTSLGGFVIHSPVTNSESLNCALVSWDHGTMSLGTTMQGFVSTPSILVIDVKLTDISHVRSNAFEFTVLGAPSFSYAVESSADFANWISVLTNKVPFRLLETNALHPRRFYRAVPAFDVLTISQD